MRERGTRSPNRIHTAPNTSVKSRSAGLPLMNPPLPFRVLSARCECVGRVFQRTCPAFRFARAKQRPFRYAVSLLNEMQAGYFVERLYLLSRYTRVSVARINCKRSVKRLWRRCKRACAGDETPHYTTSLPVSYAQVYIPCMRGLSMWSTRVTWKIPRNCYGKSDRLHPRNANKVRKLSSRKGNEFSLITLYEAYLS